MLLEKFNDAVDVIEKIDGILDESTEVGAAWATLLACIESLENELYDAQSALWRVMPNSYTLEIDGGPKPDPFEGPGETYHDAYVRLSDEIELLRDVILSLTYELHQAGESK